MINGILNLKEKNIVQNDNLVVKEKEQSVIL